MRMDDERNCGNLLVWCMRAAPPIVQAEAYSRTNQYTASVSCHFSHRFRPLATSTSLGEAAGAQAIGSALGRARWLTRESNDA